MDKIVVLDCVWGLSGKLLGNLLCYNGVKIFRNFSIKCMSYFLVGGDKMEILWVFKWRFVKNSVYFIDVDIF